MVLQANKMLSCPNYPDGKPFAKLHKIKSAQTDKIKGLTFEPPPPTTFDR